MELVRLLEPRAMRMIFFSRKDHHHLRIVGHEEELNWGSRSRVSQQ